VLDDRYESVSSTRIAGVVGARSPREFWREPRDIGQLRAVLPPVGVFGWPWLGQRCYDCSFDSVEAVEYE
jgi:hypothetical protein